MAALLRSSILISLALAISAIQPDNVNWSPLQQNGTQQVDQVVNQILESSREARNIDGYNDVYSDPNIQQALQQGNDQEARNLIKDKLCNLGLMQCENNQIAPKRPPGNIIYAQPQRPPPYRGGGGGGFPQSKPPFNTHKSEYISSPPYPFIDSSGPPASFNGPIYHSKPPGPIYEGSKPPGPIYEGPIPPGPIYEPSSSGGGGGIHYDSNFKKYQHSQKFEVSESAEKPTIIVNAQGGTPIGNQPLTGGVNTLNIHHHFHHLDDGHSKTPGPVHTNGLNTGAGAFTSLDNSFTYGGNKNFKSEFSSGASFGSINGISGNNGVYGTSGNGGINGGLTTNSLYSNGFSENAVYGGGVKPVIEEAQLLNYGNQGNSEYFNEFNGNSHVPRKQQFGSSYGGGSGNGGLSTGGFSAQITNGIYSQPNNLYSNANKYAVTSGTDYYNTGESQLQNFGLSRQGQFDCVCVPYNRCPAQDVLGRRDDLLLPLDPRHLTTKIEAILDDDIGTSNNLTRIVKHVNDETINDKNITSITDNEHNNETSTKKISKRDVSETQKDNAEARQISRQYNRYQQCPAQQVCCRTPVLQQQQQQQYENNRGQCGRRNAQGVTGRIKNPVYIDGDSEFGEYPWQAAILKKDAKESVYVCGGTLIDNLHILTAAHCVKTYSAHDLRIRLGEWDVNHDVEFFPYVERDAILLRIHPEYYAGTLDNDIAILRMNSPVNFATTPHISPACLPDKFSDFTGTRCWTTGWGKDAFGDFGKYQNILKEVDVPIINQLQCQEQLRHTRLGYTYKLNPGFICAGGEEGKDACKGDGGGPLVCDRGGIWHVVGIVSWGIGCGQVNVPGVYARVSYYLDWIQQITQTF